MQLRRPTQDTRVLVHQALAGLNRLYRDGYRYKKAGVMLVELRPPSLVQGDLFAPQLIPAESDRSQRLMDVLDRINRRMGRGTVYLASQGVQQQRKAWHLRRDMQSPRYTTAWSELRKIGHLD